MEQFFYAGQTLKTTELGLFICCPGVLEKHIFALRSHLNSSGAKSKTPVLMLRVSICITETTNSIILKTHPTYMRFETSWVLELNFTE